MSKFTDNLNTAINVTGLKTSAKKFIDYNVGDGEDKTGAKNDYTKFTRDELQELVDELIDSLFE